MAKILSSTDVAKLKQIVNEGIQVTQEMTDLREGLKDTVSAVAEELDMKPATLNRAIKIASKGQLTQSKKDFEEVAEVLTAVGRTA
jgi:transposase-like protein